MKPSYLGFIVFLGMDLFFSSGISQTAFWQRTKGFNGGVIYSMCADSSDQIWAGSVEGVWRSSDNGKTWFYLGLSSRGFISALLADRERHLFCGTWGYGIYLSVDNGQTWKQVLATPWITAIVHNSVSEILVSTSEGGFLSSDMGNSWIPFSLKGFISSLNVNENGDIFAAVWEVGIFKSTDHGATWTQLTNNLTAKYISSLVTKPAGLVFAGTNSSGVIRSADYGKSWSQANVGLDDLRVLKVGVSREGDLLACTARGLFRSIDNGARWTGMGLKISNQLHDLTFNSRGDIFVGTEYSGIYRLTSASRNWESVGLPVIPVYTLLATANDSIWAGSYGIFRSTDYGQSWLGFGPDTYIHDLVFDSHGHGYVAGHTSVYQSANGTNWYGCLSLFDPPQHNIVNTVASNSVGEIFAGVSGDREGVYRSTGQCQNWKQINQGLSNRSVNVIVVGADNTLYAGTANGAFRSLNHGDSWSPMQLGATNPAVYVFRFRSDHEIWAGTSNGIFQTTDAGVNWNHMGLPNSQVPALALNASRQIFAGTPNGVYRSTDNGMTWIEVNSGLRNLHVNALAFDSVGRLFAATDGGVFRSVPFTVPVDEQNDVSTVEFKLAQNYPNPFNSSTIITYAIPYRAEVSLVIYNTLGKEVATLVREQKDANVYQVIWNSDNVANGLYLYQLKAGSFTETKKLLLLK